MTFVVNEKATKIARARHERGVAKLATAFGVLVERDKLGRVKPPPHRVMTVLTMAGVRGSLCPKSHGPRALRRAAKRARYAANTRRNERNGWRAFHAEAKRRGVSC